MNIALVDDMPRELSRLSGIIEEYAAEHQLPVELVTFDSAEALLKAYRPLQYTLIFMDIYMEGMAGVEAVKKIIYALSSRLLSSLYLIAPHFHSFFKLLQRQGFVEIEALSDITFIMSQYINLLLSLHALGHAFKSYLMSHGNNMLEHQGCGIVLVPVILRKEASIYLQYIPWYLPDQIK